MKVFQFTVGDESWIDWVVAVDEASALSELREFSDMGDEEFDAVREVKELTEEELNTLEVHEEDNEVSQTFKQAIVGREAEMPFHLCSQID